MKIAILTALVLLPTLAHAQTRPVVNPSTLLAWDAPADMGAGTATTPPDAMAATWNLYVDGVRTTTPMPPMNCVAGATVVCQVTAPGWLAAVPKGPHALTISATTAAGEGQQSTPLLITMIGKPGQPGVLRLTQLQP